MSGLKIVDTTLEHISSDIEKIQVKPGMYISYTGRRAALHLVIETVQNNIDEVTDKLSIGKNIRIVYDFADMSITCEDDGRGIPTSEEVPLITTCTTLQSGSKFHRNDGNSAGENGVGMTAINALSDKYIIENHRYKKGVEKLCFEKGHLSSESNIIDDKNYKRHGVLVSFIPSKHIMGNDCYIEESDVIRWLSKIVRTIRTDKEINISYTVKNDKEILNEFKFTTSNDINQMEELLKYIMDNKNTMKITKNSLYLDNIQEEVNVINRSEDNLISYDKINMDRTMLFEYAFTFTNEEDIKSDAYCNFINTELLGKHYDVCRDAISLYFMRVINASLSDKDKDKGYKVLKQDIEPFLSLVVNVSTNMQMHFVGQSKSAVGNENLKELLYDKLVTNIGEYFANNQSIFNEYCKFIKLNMKARIESGKIKSSVLKNRVNMDLNKFLINKFAACNKKKGYKDANGNVVPIELYISEGDSASGSLVLSRDPDTQAIITTGGNISNVLKYMNNLSDVLKDTAVQSIISVWGCGVLQYFDINKLNYDMIIIGTDADIDGGAICSSIIVLTYMLTPGIIEAGKLFRVVPPLYKIEDNVKKYVSNKREFVELYNKKLAKLYKLYIGDVRINLDEFLLDVFKYYDNINNIAKNKKIEQTLLERTMYILNKQCKKYKCNTINDCLNNKECVKEFMNYLVAIYPELKLNGHLLSGPVKGKHRTILLNNKLIETADKFNNIYEKYGLIINVFKNKTGERNEMSIYDFLNDNIQYIPKIINRFKGLAEADRKSGDLEKTMMHKENRELIQITIDDVEETLKTMNLFFGHSKEDKVNRNNLFMNYQIDKEDIDN
jgi:DNA gyrase subunit B